MLTGSQRELYEAALATSMDGVALIGPDSRFRDVNEALCTMLGRAREEMLGLRLADVGTSLPAEAVLPAMERIRAKGKDRFESRWLRKDGALVDVEIQVAVVEGDEPLFFAFVRDVSDRKEAERALRASEERLRIAAEASRRGDALHRLFAENAAEVFWTIDLATLRFTYVSPGVERHRGYTPEEAMRQKVEEILTPSSLAKVRALLAAYAEAGRLPEGVVEIEEIRKDGSVVATEMSATVAPDASGRPQIVGVTRDVTERKRRDRELRVFEAALASASSGLVLAGLDGRITWANPAFLAMWGFRKEADVLGASVVDFWADPGEARGVAAAVVEKGLWKGELLARREDGSTFRAGVVTDRVLDADGAPICVFGSFEDVTERRRLAETLRLEKERFERAAWSGKVAMWDADLRTGRLEASGYAHPELPFRPGETMTIEGFLSSLHPDDRAAMQRAMVEHLEKGTPFDVEARVRKVDGSYLWIRDVGAAVRDGNGVPCGLSGAITDITEIKEAEATLKAYQARLEEAQALAHLGTWALDLATGRLEWSPEIYRIFGLDPTVTRVSYETFLAAIHPDDRETVREAFERSVAERTPYEIEHRVVHPGGTVRLVRERGQTLYDESGRPLRSVGTIQDITEQRLAREAESLARERDAAEAANRAKSAFLASMSHEIRTPMNAILGFAQLLLGSAGLSPRQREQAEAIQRGGEHLLGLINDVLEMSKIEAGRVTVTAAETDLHALASDVEATFRLKAREKGLALEVVRAGDLPRHVVTDEKKLRQIVFNLAGNAAKFTAKGGVKVRFHAAPGGEGRALLRVVVEDTGPGIAEEELPRLFQRFEQTRTGREAGGGTGLGLAISRAFARMMGGDVSVASRVGEGSVFTLSLPVTASALPAGSGRVEVRRVAGLPPEETRRRILVVDDVSENRDLLRQMLERVGFEVETANDGEKALARLEAWRPHLVLMDLKMPGMNGLEAMRAIRATEEVARIPLVAVTASAFDEDRREVESAGGDAFVSKPFREADLLETVGRCLDLRYVYEVPAGGGAFAQPPAGSSSIPAPLREALKAAVLGADLDAIRRLAGEVEAIDAEGAAVVRDLAERFEYERLAAWLGEGG